LKTVDIAIQEELDYIRGRKTGEITSVKCQYPAINSVYMDGFEWGWIVTIGGMSGSGKTSFMNSLEEGICGLNENVSVLSFNFEMLARRLIGRKISSITNLSVKQLYSADGVLSDDQWEHITKEVTPMLGKHDVTYTEYRQTVPEMIDTVKRFLDKKAPNGVIVEVDHSLLVKRLRNANERDTLIDLTSEFNDLKKQYPKLLFFIVSQLNRDIEEDNRIINPNLHFPRKKDLFGSDSIFQICDGVMILHRPEMLGITYYGAKQWPVKDLVYLHHLKVRDGEPVINRFKNDLKHNKLLWQKES